MSIVGSFPTSLQNGTVEDANVVMSLFTWIQTQVNTNACAATTTTNVLKGDGSGNTTAAVSGTDYLAPNADYVVGTGSANAYIATMIPALTALMDGVKIRFKSAATNTGASTLNVSGLGSKPILNYSGNALTGGEIINLGNIEVTYNASFNSGSGAWVLNQTLTEVVPNATNAVNSTNAVNLTAINPVATGGTGAATLAANNVLLGNGTSALQAVAPGTSGNVLTSTGTTWQSSTPFTWNVHNLSSPTSVAIGGSYTLAANTIAVQGWAYAPVVTASQSAINVYVGATLVSTIQIGFTVGANNGNGYYGYIPFHIAVPANATSITFTSISGTAATLYVAGYVTNQ